MLAAALTTVALLPGLLTPTVADVKEKTPLRVLLPSSLKTDETSLFASGDGSRKDYQISVSTQEDCGANACSLAFFSAYKGQKLYGTRKVTLTNGRKGRYLPLSCGGSCSPPSVQWVEKGVLYEIQMDFEKNARAELVRMANSAIKHGAR
jgi:hypothetical protein